LLNFRSGPRAGISRRLAIRRLKPAARYIAHADEPEGVGEMPTSAFLPLDAAAHAVNFVWNHGNGAQRHALKHNQRWAAKSELQASTRGAGKLIGIPAQTDRNQVSPQVHHGANADAPSRDHRTAAQGLARNAGRV
jgi:hypothetical protein